LSTTYAVQRKILTEKKASIDLMKRKFLHKNLLSFVTEKKKRKNSIKKVHKKLLETEILINTIRLKRLTGLKSVFEKLSMKLKTGGWKSS
jgi:hypothetical protein